MVTTEKLIACAQKAASKAYVPYSQFAVGAAVVTATGEVFSGCNIENASFGLTNCAERTAIFKAISEGYRDLTALVVYGNTHQPIAPCGACRQVMAEFFSPAASVTLVGQTTQRTMTVSELLPYAFRELS